MKSTIAAILRPPRGLNRALMTSPTAMRLRPALVTTLMLATGSACVLTALTPVFGLSTSLLVMLFGQLAAHTAAHLYSFKMGQTQVDPEQQAAITSLASNPAVTSFARDMAEHVLAPHLPRQCIHLSEATENYEMVTFTNGGYSLRMNPSALTRLYQEEVEQKGQNAGTESFAALHSYALMHEIGHTKQSLLPKLAGLGLSLAGWVGLVTSTAASLSNIISPGSTPLIFAHLGTAQALVCAGAAVSVMVTNAIQKRQNELDADLYAVRELGSSHGARIFFERLATRQATYHLALWSPNYHSPALRLDNAEQLERQLPAQHKQSAQQAFQRSVRQTLSRHEAALSKSTIDAQDATLAQLRQQQPRP